MCWENWKSICSKKKLNPCLSPCTKLNSKWIKDIGIRPETLHQIEETETNPHKYGYLILDKVAKNIRWRKDSLINKQSWEKWKSICSKMKSNPHLSPCTKLNSKWIKDLVIRPEILQQTEEEEGWGKGKNNRMNQTTLPYVNL